MRQDLRLVGRASEVNPGLDRLESWFREAGLPDDEVLEMRLVAEEVLTTGGRAILSWRPLRTSVGRRSSARWEAWASSSSAGSSHTPATRARPNGTCCA